MNLVILGGKYHRKKIKTLKGLSIRPTSSKCKQALFNICQKEIKGTDFLDLFAGFGAIGIEALSRGAANAVFVENKREAARYIKSNLKNLGIKDEATVVCKDVFLFLKKNIKKFDIVYIDPPYKYYEDINFIKKILSELYINNALKKKCLIFLESSSLLKKEKIEKLQIDNFTIYKIRKYGSSYLIEVFFEE